MAMLDFRSTIAWQSTIALGPRIVRLAEELPAHEQTGLMAQLSTLMVGLPAAIASDVTEGTAMRFVYYYRLLAAFDLIDRVYPALDTATAKQALEELGDRITPEKINDKVFSAAPVENQPQYQTVQQPEAPAPTPAPIPQQTMPTYNQLPQIQQLPVQPQEAPIPPQIVSIPVAGPISLTAATAAEDAQGVAPAPLPPQQLPGYVQPNSL